MTRYTLNKKEWWPVFVIDSDNDGWFGSIELSEEEHGEYLRVMTAFHAMQELLQARMEPFK